MYSDGHIHLWNERSVPDPVFAENLKSAGVSCGVLISLPPPCFRSAVNMPCCERLEHLFLWQKTAPGLYPFFWIDPTEKDAEEQIELAVKAGVSGFKVICDHFFPYEERPMKLFQMIADRKKPILFHSGCLANGRASSNFNRPMNFECLINIRNLRFSMAHIGWPWCDEYIALFLLLQWQEPKHPENCRMFIDNTAGTPAIYRKEVFEKLFSVCDVRKRFYFGSDQLVENYDAGRVASGIRRDEGICRELKLSPEEIHDIQFTNLKRFVEGID